MFYTYAEKKNRSFFGDWHLREVAFDTRRRYLYYTEPLGWSLASTTQPPPHASNPHATVAAINEESSNDHHHNHRINHTSASSASTEVETSGGRGGSRTREVESSESAAVAAAVCPIAFWHRARWEGKMKVFDIVPVATVRKFDLHDPTLRENDFFQIKILGEGRRLLKDEVPPVGPLLCPSAGFTTLHPRCSLEDEDFIKDPHHLLELFEAIRDQFEEMEHERRRARRTGAAATPDPHPTQTLKSPTNPPNGGYPKKKITLRCREELEFRRFWFVLQSVLGYDKLMLRPYRGLPPYDPRNGVSFAHIPMLVWHTFKALDKAVFYVFTRGDLLGVGESNTLEVLLEGAYMCITHDMILFMRDTGNIPWWLRQHHISELYYRVGEGGEPFLAFLSDPPARDVIFIPRPPAYGARAIAGYDPRFDVKHAVRVMSDVCFASLDVRRAIRIGEVEDATAAAFVRRLAGEERAGNGEGERRRGEESRAGGGGGGGGGRPLRAQGGGLLAQGVLSCPLPKEQLASVWEQVQAELRARSEIVRSAAIPITERNAREVCLSREQLTILASQLEEERERLDDIVGMPLERAQQMRPMIRRGSGALPSSSSSPTSPLHTGWFETPQLIAPPRRITPPRRSGASSGSERSSYLMPGTRYLTAESEKESENAKGDVASGNREPDGVPRGEERTVDEIIDRCMLAMGMMNK
ncbi:unnamed protein product [Phytomonas sp. EM1]|nr:unnamed protein product [Phytomonas sp. EM1]|eukprot:CCW65524.1 unnamed protein product [Phytomonas sp. isolate EM1]